MNHEDTKRPSRIGSGLRAAAALTRISVRLALCLRVFVVACLAVGVGRTERPTAPKFRIHTPPVDRLYGEGLYARRFPIVIDAARANVREVNVRALTMSVEHQWAELEQLRLAPVRNGQAVWTLTITPPDWGMYETRIYIEIDSDADEWVEHRFRWCALRPGVRNLRWAGVNVWMHPLDPRREFVLARMRGAGLSRLRVQLTPGDVGPNATGSATTASLLTGASTLGLRVLAHFPQGFRRRSLLTPARQAFTLYADLIDEYELEDGRIVHRDPTGSPDALEVKGSAFLAPPLAAPETLWPAGGGAGQRYLTRVGWSNVTPEDPVFSADYRQAGYVSRLLALAGRYGETPVYFTRFTDGRAIGRQAPADYGLVEADLQPKRAYVTVAALAVAIGERRFNRALIETPHVRAYLFGQGDDCTLVCWTTGDTAFVSLEGLGRMAGLRNWMGRSQPRPTRDGQLLLDLSRRPYMILGVSDTITAELVLRL